MRSNKRVVIIGAALGVTLLTAPVTASAATPYWANTSNNADSNGLTVYWCAGGSATLAAGARTTKNVCGIKMRHNRELFVFVDKTGTVLFDRVNCGDDYRISFNTKNDTSNTALVYYGEAGCV